ncbi:MAG: UDP-N-acetylmuramate--L-alanine ligase [Planctomycetota bacterium]
MTRAASHNRIDAPRPTLWDVSGRRAHLIGIGGCGMSALARMLRARGAHVAGSDLAESPVTASLGAEGIAITFDQQAGHLDDSCDLLIASAAVKPDHPEWLAAEARGIETLTYPEALGRCMLGRTGVAIAGTHGKSTTAAMLGHALITAGIDPTVIVGATCPDLAPAGEPATGFRLGNDTIASGTREGEPGVLIAEACEFNRSFHNLHPRVGAITSVEADHLDIYGSLDEVVRAFAEFAQRIPAADRGGWLLIHHDRAHRREVTAGLACEVETIGFTPSADWQVTFDQRSRRVGLLHHAKPVLDFIAPTPGIHMAMNAAYAAAIAIRLGAEPALVAGALATFRGVDRRLQFLGEVPSSHSAPPIRVYDDYGHHPTEIDETLRALREAERPQERGGRLICVFQPHQHSRTRFFLEEFAQSFSQADVVIVPHIYFVRDGEAEKARVGAPDLVDRLRTRGVRAMHLYPFEAIVEQLQNMCRPGDLLVVMGAGPVWQVARGFMEAATPASA